MTQKSSSFFSQDQVNINLIDGASGNKSVRNLSIALSIHARELPQRFLWAKDNSFALEYNPDPTSLHLISSHVKMFISHGIPVRFHCRFFEHEIGNTDSEKADEATQVHLRVIEAISSVSVGEPVVTVHMNLLPHIPFDLQRGVENLARLVKRGHQLGVVVCLENLRRGHASNPKTIVKWAKASGAMITMDIGHAISSEQVKNGKVAVLDIVNMFSERLYEVHMYGKEEDRHYPIENIIEVKPIINRLLTTQCSWWTIELDDCTEALNTREIILNYLSAINK